jgi:ferritin-like protein
VASEGLHEDASLIRPDTVERHRAVTSLKEELEAIDWYDQRAAASDDDELRAVLEHNRDDEKEHAAMALEWLRRRDARLDEQLRKYLFTEGSITAKEDEAAAGDDVDSGSLGIGSLRTEVTS